MLSINMRIFKTVLLIASFGASVRCLPVGDKSSEGSSDAQTVHSPIRTVPLAESKATSALSTETPTATTAIVNTPTSSRSDTTDYYDQRQNGTENYRIHVDGVVLVFAPVETLLLAGAAGTTESSLSLFDYNNKPPAQAAGELDKPSTGAHNKTESAISKTIHRSGLRLANLLAPFLRRAHHERDTSAH